MFLSEPAASLNVRQRDAFKLPSAACGTGLSQKVKLSGFRSLASGCFGSLAFPPPDDRLTADSAERQNPSTTAMVATSLRMSYRFIFRDCLLSTGRCQQNINRLQFGDPELDLRRWGAEAPRPGCTIAQAIARPRARGRACVLRASPDRNSTVLKEALR